MIINQLIACEECRDCSCATCKAFIKKAKANARSREARKSKDDAMRSLGLVKVKGALGGTYWE